MDAEGFRLRDVSETAEILHVSRFTVRRMAAGPAPRLRPTRIGSRLLFHPDDIAACIDRARNGDTERETDSAKQPERLARRDVSSPSPQKARS